MGERVGGFDGVRVGASVGDVGNYQDCYYELDRGGGAPDLKDQRISFSEQTHHISNEPQE